MEFGLLGPLAVRRDGIAVPVPQGKQRTLLAALLLNAGTIVSLDDLTGALWGAAPPPSSRVTIQNYVMRLRKALGDADGTRITTHAGGYSIAVADGESDIARFRASLAASRAAARDGRWDTASAEARTALSLWRGEPLADVDSALLSTRDVPRLAELRLQALETRVDADLRLGYDDELVAELRQLTAAHPLREHLRAQLMLALYQHGRQAEALAAYREVRELLVRELGTEPGPELRDLHQQILGADPALPGTVTTGMVTPGLVTSAAGATSAGGASTLIPGAVIVTPPPAAGGRDRDGGNGHVASGRGRDTRAADDARSHPGPSPYRGLAAFTERDAPLFFGRETATAEVVDRLAARLDGGGLVVVSGVSGAGKSSLLRAGVLPRVRDGGLPGAPEASSWPRVVCAPGHDPLEELAVRIAPLIGADAAEVHERLTRDPAGFALTVRQAALTSAGPQGRVLLVIDQCEQLFTLCESPARRQAFVTALSAAATARPYPAALVVVAVRADFEARLADYPELSAAVQDRYLLTAMTRRQLRLAIARPAVAAGSCVDDDLVTVLLDEVYPGAAVLPLLSHALDQAWRTRAGGPLTLSDYERAGGIEGAVAASAQRAYDGLSPGRRTVARQVFTMLTATGDDGTDTAARAWRTDLTAGKDADGIRDVDAVLETFAAERLLTLDAETVEISHEALLTAWPLLRDTWLADARADRVTRTRLRATAAEWRQAARDPSYLYQGSRLDTAAGTAARIEADTRLPPLSQTEKDFLQASRRASRRRLRSRREVTAVLLALVVALTVVWAVSVHDGRAAATQRDILAAQELISESGSSAATAAQIQSVQAWSLDHSPQAYAAMLAAAANPEIKTIDTGSDVSSLAFSANGAYFATGSDDGAVQVWDTATRRKVSEPLGASTTGSTVLGFGTTGSTLVTYAGAAQVWDGATASQIGGAFAYAVGASSPLRNMPAPSPGLAALSADGSSLVTLGSDGTTQLWNTATGADTGSPFTTVSGATAVALSADGADLATAGDDGAVTLWKLPDRRRAGRPLPASTARGASPVFSPGGSNLATISADGTARIWDSATGRETGAPLTADTPLNCAPAGGCVLAFSPDGRLLAAGDSDGTIVIWNVATGQQIGGPLTSGASVDALAFSPSGRTLAAGGQDGTVRIWDIALATFRPGGTALAHAFSAGVTATLSPDDKTLATISAGGVVRLWDAATGRETPRQPDTAGHSGTGDATIRWAGFSPDSATLATLDTTGTVRLWNVATGQPAGQPLTVAASAAALAPGGKVMTVTDPNGPVQLWDPATGQPAGKSFGTDSAFIDWLAPSPDGKTVAIGDSAGTVSVWKVATGQLISTISDATGSYPAAFSPDGSVLATVTSDGAARLWDVATGQPIGGPLPGGDVVQTMFTNGGNTLNVVTADGTTRQWNVSYLASPLKVLCTRLGGAITQADWHEYVPPGPGYRNGCPA
jgi:WD40 repeat protein/DNA-binding SARP family transcriptional activator